MKLYYGTSTAWTGELICDIVSLCGDSYRPDDPRSGLCQVYSNFKTALVMMAEAILTRNGDRNYRYTIETYFHQMCRPTPPLDERHWDWGQFVLKGRIPFGATGFFTVDIKAEQVGAIRCLSLEVGCHGRWDEARRQVLISKVGTWKQDILVAWLHRWNWRILQLPIAADGHTMCVGEYLAAQLFKNCGDEAGHNATLDEVQDRGKRWLLS